MEKIKLEKFCDMVSMKSQTNIVSEQIKEAIGGIANLYLEHLINNNLKEITFQTNLGFATRKLKIPNKFIIKEISNCTGTSQKRSKVILEDINAIILYYVNLFEVKYNKQPFLFKPLGIFKVINIKNYSFKITFRDPAADYYKEFLLR